MRSGPDLEARAARIALALFDVDGVLTLTARLHAAALGVDSGHCAMVEDAIIGQAEALRSHGADLVVKDLGELLAQ